MTTFKPGYQKVQKHYLGNKEYHPFIYRAGQRRYAYKGRLSFRTATRALQYAIRWSERAQSFLDVQAEISLIELKNLMAEKENSF